MKHRFVVEIDADDGVSASTLQDSIAYALDRAKGEGALSDPDGEGDGEAGVTGFNVSSETREAEPFDDEIIAKARRRYASDNIEIDADPALSHADDGCWVAAWVWVPGP